MKNLQLVICVLAMSIYSYATYAQNNVGIELCGGVDYSPRERAGEKIHFGFGYDKQMLGGNSFVGISMSGKRQILRQQTDTIAGLRQFYVLELKTGVSLSEERSKLFAGPIVLVGGGVCWDNWKLDGSFPVFFSTALQLNLNVPQDIELNEEKFGIGFFGRCMYQNFYYRVIDEPNDPSQSRVNPMIVYQFGLRLTLKGSD